MVGIIHTSVKYFKQCELPKIESKLESETIHIIGEIVNSLPFALQIKEAEDIFMMLNAFYSMIEYIDHHDYINTGVQVGKIAYDLKCMFEGKSTLGFLQLTVP